MKKTKKILIFQTGEPTHFDNIGAPMRLVNLADKLIENNFKVEIITTSFIHQTKQFRNISKNKYNFKNKYKYIFFKSPGYKKNISLARLYDHFILAKNLNKMLKHIKNINYVFIGYPPIECSFILSRWCKKNKIPYLVDYKDLWPELFMYKKKLFYQIIFYPFYLLLKILRDYTIRHSKSVCTISNSFINDLQIKDINKKKCICYLTKKKSNENSNLISKDIKNRFLSSLKIKIVFIGHFGTDVYDFKILHKIKKFLVNSPNLEIYLFGDLNKNKEILNMLNFKNLFIMNRVNSSEFHYICSKSQLVFLPIKNRFDFIKCLPNKFIDALQYKLPIITCLKGEARKLIQKYKLGFVYNNASELKYILSSFSKKTKIDSIKKNFNHPDIKQMFDHDLNYKKLIDRIKSDIQTLG